MDELFERLGELGELDAQIERAAAGQGCLAVVEGPAGIGKSRLLAEARRRAESSMRVLSSRGSELEGEFPFGVVRQLFDSELADPARRDALMGGAAGATAGIFGELHAGSDGASFASLHGLSGLVLALADEGPLLLSVDDLHWCDRPSLMFLTFLARRIEGRPILLLTGLREAEPGNDPGLLGELVHDPAATRIRPGPLGEGAVTALVEDRLARSAEREFVAACLESTGGNPLLLTQLVIALAGEGVLPDAQHVAHVNQIGPRAISRTVLVRLARLRGQAQSVARAVAVLGDGADLPAVATLARVDEGQVAEATRELARAEILRPQPPLGFVHPLVREAIYQDLSVGERELEHARAATLLREVGAPVDRIAAQLLHTAPRGEPWAAELLWEAGRGAMHAGAADSAVAYLRRALDQLPAEAETAGDSERARLLFELGVAEALTNGAAAQEHLALAREGLSDPLDRGAAAGLLARTVLFRGAPEEAASIAAGAAAELPPELEDLRMELEALESMAVFFGADHRDHRDRLERLRRHRGHIPQNLGSRMLTSVAAWETLCTDGTAAESAELALAALEGGRLWAADPNLIPFAAVVSLVVADRPEVVEVWKGVLEAAHRHGSLVSASSAHLWLGYSHLCRGDLAAAAESLREADEAFTLWGHDAYANATSRSIMVEVMRESGRLTEAERMLDQIGEVPPNTQNAGLSLTGRIGILIATNRAAEAVAVADELAALGEAVPDASRLWWRSLKAEALDRVDRREEALELVREELVVTSAFGAPSWLGRTLRVLGTLEGDDGLGNLQEAVTVLEGSTARLEHAKALAALGFGLRRARKPTEARDPLRRALELAAACGADPLAERVRSELRASGARPRREALGGVDSLTASERRVADLAARGRTNREIAQELYVTLKTVEVHLSNTYRKLDIASRRELPRALGESAA